METKKPRDFITDGVLACGVLVGRFVFEEGNRTVYALTDCVHAGASDAYMYYQLSRKNYNRLLGLSCLNGIPDPPVPSSVTEAYHQVFLCGESAYCKRNTFSLEEADTEMVEGC